MKKDANHLCLNALLLVELEDIRLLYCLLIKKKSDTFYIAICWLMMSVEVVSYWNNMLLKCKKLKVILYSFLGASVKKYLAFTVGILCQLLRSIDWTSTWSWYPNIFSAAVFFYLGVFRSAMTRCRFLFSSKYQISVCIFCSPKFIWCYYSLTFSIQIRLSFSPPILQLLCIFIISAFPSHVFANFSGHYLFGKCFLLVQLLWEVCWSMFWTRNDLRDDSVPLNR